MAARILFSMADINPVPSDDYRTFEAQFRRIATNSVDAAAIVAACRQAIQSSKDCSVAHQQICGARSRARIQAKSSVSGTGKQPLSEKVETNAQVQTILADLAELEQLTAMLHALYVPLWPPDTVPTFPPLI